MEMKKFFIFRCICCADWFKSQYIPNGWTDLTLHYRAGSLMHPALCAKCTCAVLNEVSFFIKDAHTNFKKRRIGK